MASVYINMAVIFSPMDANTVLLFIGMIVGIFVYWKKGGNQATTEVLAIYKSRDELQDKQRTEMMDQIHTLTGEVGRLNGILSEKEARIKILESVDVGRNPVLMQFMEKLTKTALDSEIFMAGFKDLPQMLNEINTSLHALNAQMAKAA